MLNSLRGTAVLGEQVKAPLPRRHRAAVVVQARYSYDEDDAPSRRPSRPTRSFDEGDAYAAPSRRGAGAGRGQQASWDDDFDAPSRMGREERRPQRSDTAGRGDGGYQGRGAGQGGGGYQGQGQAGRSGAGGWGEDRQERGGGGRGYGREDGGGGYASGPGGGGGPRQYGGDRGGGDRGGQQYGERRGWARDAQMNAEQREQRMQVNQAIKEASSWRELAALVEEKGGVLDAEHASSILFKLSFRPFNARGGSNAGPQGSVDFVRPRDEAAALEYDRLLSTLLGWVLVLMPTFRPRQVSMCLQSLAKLELWNEEVITALVAAAIKHIINFEPNDYGNIMWAFAKFNYNPGQAFFDAFLDKSARRLQSMGTNDLAKIVSGMSKTGCVPSAAWAEAFWKASADQIMDFTDVTSGDLFMAAAYFAQSGVQPPQQWVDYVYGAYVETDAQKAVRMAEAQAAYQKQVQAHEAAQAKLKDDAKGGDSLPPKPQVPDFQVPKVHVINKMLYALSNLSCKPPPPVLSALVEAWRRQLQYCSAADLGNIALYLGRYLQIGVSSNHCAQLLRTAMGWTNTRNGRGEIRGDDLAAVAYLLSASQYKGSEKEIDDLVFHIKQRLPECSLSGLELVYNALPALGAGYRLNETVTEAANRYNDLLAKEQQAAGGAQPEQQAQQQEQQVAQEPVAA